MAKFKSKPALPEARTKTKEARDVKFRLPPKSSIGHQQTKHELKEHGIMHINAAGLEHSGSSSSAFPSIVNLPALLRKNPKPNQDVSVPSFASTSAHSRVAIQDGHDLSGTHAEQGQTGPDGQGHRPGPHAQDTASKLVNIAYKQESFVLFSPNKPTAEDPRILVLKPKPKNQKRLKTSRKKKITVLEIVSEDTDKEKANSSGLESDESYLQYYPDVVEESSDVRESSESRQDFFPVTPEEAPLPLPLQPKSKTQLASALHINAPVEPRKSGQVRSKSKLNWDELNNLDVGTERSINAREKIHLRTNTGYSTAGEDEDEVAWRNPNIPYPDQKWPNKLLTSIPEESPPELYRKVVIHRCRVPSTASAPDIHQDGDYRNLDPNSPVRNSPVRTSQGIHVPKLSFHERLRISYASDPNLRRRHSDILDPSDPDPIADTATDLGHAHEELESALSQAFLRNCTSEDYAYELIEPTPDSTRLSHDFACGPENYPIGFPPEYLPTSQHALNPLRKIRRIPRRTVSPLCQESPAQSAYLKRSPILYTKVVGTSFTPRSLFPTAKLPPYPQTPWNAEGLGPAPKDELPRDFIKTNSLQSTRTPAKIPFPKFVDDPSGNVQPWCASGLARFYVYKPDYGKVPSYLNDRKEQLGLRRGNQRCFRICHPNHNRNYKNPNHPNPSYRQTLDYLRQQDFYDEVHDFPSAGYLPYESYNWNHLLTKDEECEQQGSGHGQQEPIGHGRNSIPHDHEWEEDRCEEDEHERDEDSFRRADSSTSVSGLHELYPEFGVEPGDECTNTEVDPSAHYYYCDDD